ncbi:uncharacterized protein DUF2233 [Micromonospora pisi]|uniref:Uncharacterized protein DUF2233 n=1 Tax=Micromonospora pisi TaxID=589240 RepID=A0A495JRN5_9ACTN|nr:phosphodiester glycosidase family protein [Micromonospora pisi]RKR91024.1 uncharacterized protein DUF2233 [Micromonospora pisi]
MRPPQLVRRPLALLLSLALATLVVPAGAAWAATPTGAATPTSTADGLVHYTGGELVAPGVTYLSFELDTPRGPAVGHVVTADLRQRKVVLDLLHPDAVAQRQVISTMTDEQGAVAGVNGDFFNISETHEGVEPTGSAVGPEIAGGEDLKAAVPNAQRFGPGLPAGTSTRDVFGVGINGSARVTSLTLRGEVRSRSGAVIPLRGLNQYALPVDGVGLFDSDWGSASRIRATCGSDTSRNDPCTDHTYEVTVHDGVVTSISRTPGSGAIPADTVVLVGREGGADQLDDLLPGDRVNVRRQALVTDDKPALTFAVGGFPILRSGQPLAGLDNSVAAVRTAAGTSADGRTVYLVALDGRSSVSTGLTVSELATLLRSFGADAAVNLDGGGSSTLAARHPGATTATVRNSPSGGVERAVANGIGVFIGRD